MQGRTLTFLATVLLRGVSIEADELYFLCGIEQQFEIGRRIDVSS